MEIGDYPSVVVPRDDTSDVHKVEQTLTGSTTVGDDCGAVFAA